MQRRFAVAPHRIVMGLIVSYTTGILTTLAVERLLPLLVPCFSQ